MMSSLINLLNVLKWLICFVIAYILDGPRWALGVLAALVIYNLILFIFVYRKGPLN